MKKPLEKVRIKDLQEMRNLSESQAKREKRTICDCLEIEPKKLTFIHVAKYYDVRLHEIMC
ncbi:MAG: hypothetical protein ABJO02_03380 [Reichenbachiella sp.]|uniref:hypothetical protein n=1 Tax=Reichenbachiella sp. TaxID=2184521 RepID=UPI0032999803